MHRYSGSFSEASLKVAIVDDSPIVVERLMFLFSDFPVQMVGFAANVTDAKLLVNERQPDVVVLDLRLEGDAPAFNGMHLIEGFRSQYPAMTIIMLTNHALQQYRDKCLKLGANYFFDKSNEFDKVLEVIKTLA